METVLPDTHDLPRVEEVPEMTFSSSPVLYPMSSSPTLAPTIKQKRRLFQTLDIQQPLLKKPRLASIDVQLFDDPSFNAAGADKENVFPIVEEAVSPMISRTTVRESEVVSKSLPQPPPEHEISQLPQLKLGRGLTRKTVDIQTCSGKSLRLQPRMKQALQTYEQVISERSVTAAGRAKRAYYGIDIHQLVDDANIQQQLNEAAKELQLQKDAELQPSIEKEAPSKADAAKALVNRQMWTEKYRAKKFTELVGDERTHRSVLTWLKAWDDIVFPGTAKSKVKKKMYQHGNDDGQEQYHRKIMLLTGPPGLGKTTLAHVCAKQAGYEVLEINASDDRSRDVVKGRIKDALGTETVRGIQETGKARRAGRPVCVVVDEVDGVVAGSGGSGGEGGFMKALVDLVNLDQQNSTRVSGQSGAKPKKGDRFRLLRPLILICNDVYAPSLRPLRSSSIAEIVHVRKPPIEKVVARLKTVFEKESINCDNDAARRLCEDCWGVGNRKQNSKASRGVGDGDIRGVLVQGEWMAHKLRVTSDGSRLTKKWLEAQISESTSKGRKNLGRGGIREVVERIFIDGAGLPHQTVALSAEETRQVQQSKAAPLGVADLRKRSAITALREMIDTCGDHDRVMTDCFSNYPNQTFQDDTLLSKPNASYEWLHFHDSLSSRIFSGQEWELNPYLNTSACAFHDLFASADAGTSSWSNETEKADHPENVHPFSGPRADFSAYETKKQNDTVLAEMQSNFPGELLRLFSSVDVIATELIPNVNRILSPDVKPVVVGGSGGGPSVASVRKESERGCVRNAVQVMNALNIAFEKVRIENEGYGGTTVSGGYALRMEPPIDTLSTYHVSSSSSTSKPAVGVTSQPTRYAVRQVLDQELRKEKTLQASLTRQARGGGALVVAVTIEEQEQKAYEARVNRPVKILRDFFGRPIAEVALPEVAVPGTVGGAKIDASTIAKSTAMKGKAKSTGSSGGRIWVSFNEGFSNAVRKPITLADLMDSF